MHYLIIGGCAAGLSAIEGIREVDQKSEITLISKEKYPPYARCLITDYLIGTHTESSLYLKDDIFYKANKVNLITGKEVKKIFPSEKTVLLPDNKISYDKLLIATGSSPKKLRIKGEEKEGVFNFRAIDDVKNILKKLNGCRKAVIFGGGLIGLKAGYALKKKGVEVEIVVKSSYILSQVVNKEAALIISKWLEENGISIKTGIDPVEILGDKYMEGVIFDNGERMEAQIAIIAKGVSPNLSLVQESGIKTHTGIIVDDYLKTNVPYIFSAGDVAEAKDLITQEYALNALWSNAQEQGRVVGINMAGGEKRYYGTMRANAAEFFGLPFISIGKVRETENSEIIEISDERNYVYKRFILKNDVLIGAVFIGDVYGAGMYMSLIRSKVNIKDHKKEFGRKWFEYGKVRYLIEKEKGVMESITPEGNKFFFM